MATTKKTAPQGAAAPVLDLTPANVINWLPLCDDTPVLIVNPAATFGQRVALAYTMCELRGLVDRAYAAAEDQDTARILPAVAALDERVALLCRQMEAVGSRAADMARRAA